jgi:predicted dehydrogenase
VEVDARILRHRRGGDFHSIEELHAPMALAAMKAGKHAFVEVPAALTLEECRSLVDVSRIERGVTA